MYKRIRPHLPQMFRYLISGGTAAGLEIASYQVMLWIWGKEWFFTAGKISGGVGLVAAFLGHKFFAFKKREQSRRQLIRYVILQTCNYFIQLWMLYVFVTFLGVHETLAKILAIGITVMWNFFVYKWFVYA